VSAAFSGKGPRPWLAFPALILLGVCQMMLGFGSNLHWAVVWVTVAGFMFVGTMIRLGTALIQVTPDAFRGRVTSLQQIGFRAGQPLGALLAGLIAARLGIVRAFWGFGGLLIVGLLVLLACRGPRSLRSLEKAIPAND